MFLRLLTAWLGSGEQPHPYHNNSYVKICLYYPTVSSLGEEISLFTYMRSHQSRPQFAIQQCSLYEPMPYIAGPLVRHTGSHEGGHFLSPSVSLSPPLSWLFLVVSLTVSGMNYKTEMEDMPVIQILRLEDRLLTQIFDMEILRHSGLERFRPRQGSTHF